MSVGQILIRVHLPTQTHTTLAIPDTLTVHEASNRIFNKLTLTGKLESGITEQDIRISLHKDVGIALTGTDLLAAYSSGKKGPLELSLAVKPTTPDSVQPLEPTLFLSPRSQHKRQSMPPQPVRPVLRTAASATTVMASINSSRQDRGVSCATPGSPDSVSSVSSTVSSPSRSVSPSTKLPPPRPSQIAVQFSPSPLPPPALARIESAEFPEEEEEPEPPPTTKIDLGACNDFKKGPGVDWNGMDCVQCGFKRIQHISVLFKEADRANSGEVNAQQARKFLEKICAFMKLPAGEAESLVKQLDLEGNGRITWDQLMAFRQQQLEMKEEEGNEKDEEGGSDKPHRRNASQAWEEAGVTLLQNEQAAAESAAILQAEMAADGRERMVSIWSDEKIAKKKQEVLNAAGEILSTERTYVESLSKLEENWYKPLKEGKPKLLANDELDILFRNLFSQIKLMQEKLLAELEAHRDDPIYGAILLGKYGPHMLLYKTYSAGVKISGELIGRLFKRSKFRAFHDEVMEKTGTDGRSGLSLESYLIMPIQRVMRYEMLTTRMIKSTPPDEPTYLQQLMKTDKQLVQIACEVDEAVEEYEKTKALKNLFYRLKGGPEDLVSPSRSYVREGPLTKCCRSADKEFYFCLFNDLLIYGHKGARGMITVHHTMSMKDHHLRTETTQPGEYPTHSFAILSEVRSFAVYGATEQESAAWKKDIDKLVQSFGGNSAPADLSKCKPLWRKDGAETMCPICKKSFTIVNRRHHCRKCGNLMDNACSRHVDGVRYCIECNPDTPKSPDSEKSFVSRPTASSIHLH